MHILKYLRWLNSFIRPSKDIFDAGVEISSFVPQGRIVPVVARDQRRRTYLLPFKIFFLFCLSSNTTFASGFGEKFGDWILGERAQAGVDLLEQSIMDEESNKSLSCHNGNRASVVTPKAAGVPSQFQGTMNNDHPVGMNYNVYASKKTDAYKSRVSLAPAIRLVDGRVSCVSCYSLKPETQMPVSGFIKVGFNNDKTNQNCTASDELTVGSRSTDLCLACHIM